MQIRRTKLKKEKYGWKIKDKSLKRIRRNKINKQANTTKTAQNAREKNYTKAIKESKRTNRKQR